MNQHYSLTIGWAVLFLAATATTTTMASAEDKNHRNLRISVADGSPKMPTEAEWREALTKQTRQQKQCRNLAEILCGTEGLFGSFCELLTDSGAFEDLLAEELGDSTWTVFAPTNSALEDLPPAPETTSVGLESNNETDAGDWEDLFRTDLLEFHILQNQVLNGADLACGDTLLMSNGGATTVVCDETQSGSLFLAGSGNTEEDRPKIVVQDVVACNGVIHVLDKVLIDGGDDEAEVEEEEEDAVVEPLTAAPVESEEPDQKAEIAERPVDSECPSIREVVCDIEELSSMCAYLWADDIVSWPWEVSASSSSWTLFAPTNDAFDYIADVLERLDPDTTLDILRYHTLQGVHLSQDLGCDTEWLMGNGQVSTTKCSEFSGFVYQVGPGNVSPRNPRIVETDLLTCSGVVHTVNYVMLPDF